MNADNESSTEHRRLRDRVEGARARADETKRSLIERAEKERAQHEPVRALFRLYENDRDRGGGLLAGGLAYRIFIWLLPAALFTSTLARLIADVGDKPASEIAKDLGMGAALAATIDQAATQAGRAAPVLLVIGLALMIWAARGVLKALRLVSALAWGMRPTPLRSPIRPTLVTAFILVALPVYGVATAPLYRGALAGDIVATVLSTVGIAALVVWTTRVLPHPDGIGWLQCVPGAVLFSVGMGGLRLATAVYFAGKLERVDDVYGAVGFAAVFMTFLYLVARLAVLGFMANAAFRHSFGDLDEGREGNQLPPI
jgi:uncharacterized BrkB/YihY/UPF0761 family membrane protein